MTSKKIKAVLDANVFVAALHWRGLCHRILLALEAGGFIHVTSMEIIFELLRSLRHYFDHPNGDAYEIHNLIREISTIVLPRFSVLEKVEVCRDPADDKFIECALWGQADYIVTQDKDLLDLEEHQGIKIVTPQEFWDILHGEKERFNARQTHHQRPDGDRG